MNVIKTSTIVAALALSLAASCVMAQSDGSSGTSGYGSSYGSGSSNDPSLDTMPPTSSGTTPTDTAPSSINPDKGPHGATKVNKSHKTKARHKRRSGDTDPRDPHQVNGGMDSESPSGTPSR